MATSPEHDPSRQPAEPETEHLAEYLFNPAIQDTAFDEAYAATFNVFEKPGDPEAEARFTGALDRLIDVLDKTRYGPYSTLTDGENERWAYLCRKKFVEHEMEWESGYRSTYTTTAALPEDEEYEFQVLQAKIYGHEPPVK